MKKEIIIPEVGKTDWPKQILIILLVIGFLVTVEKINASSSNNKLLLDIGIGLLAFVAIFYSFILKKEVKEKRRTILITKWKTNLLVFTNILKDLKSESNKKLPDYTKMLSYSNDLSARLESMTFFEKEMDTEYQLYWAVVSLLAVIILIFVDSLTNWAFSFSQFKIYLRSIATAFMWFGFYKVIMLVVTWTKISKS